MMIGLSRSRRERPMDGEQLSTLDVEFHEVHPWEVQIVEPDNLNRNRRPTRTDGGFRRNAGTARILRIGPKDQLRASGLVGHGCPVEVNSVLHTVLNQRPLQKIRI